MNEFAMNPIDLAPFIGASQSPEGIKRKLTKLYEADAQKYLDAGDTDAYSQIMEKIKTLNDGDNNNNN